MTRPDCGRCDRAEAPQRQDGMHCPLVRRIDRTVHADTEAAVAYLSGTAPYCPHVVPTAREVAELLREERELWATSEPQTIDEED